jgi:hypothetical protein
MSVFLTKAISIGEIGIQGLPPIVINLQEARKHLIFTCSLKNPQRGEERRGDETNNTLLPTSPCLFTAQFQDKNCEAPIPVGTLMWYES